MIWSLRDIAKFLILMTSVEAGGAPSRVGAVNKASAVRLKPLPFGNYRILSKWYPFQIPRTKIARLHLKNKPNA